MNTYKKYCPNVYVAQCEEKHQKGDVITLTTKRGKENQHIVHNFVGYTGTKENPLYCYSITRVDGFDARQRALNKLEKLNQWADNADKRSKEWHEKSNEGRDFLALGEPIKIGHHSERRHRNLIERNWNRMGNAVKEADKAQAYRERMSYWEDVAETINLSMPESIEFFEIQLEEAKAYHKGLKDGTIQKEHSYSMAYANKKVKELQKKYELSIKLWGETKD